MSSLIIPFIVINGTGFLLCLWDKFCAVSGKWRIRESLFFSLGLMMGAPGILVGMQVAHHKVSKPSFYRVIYLEVIMNIAVLAYLLK